MLERLQSKQYLHTHTSTAHRSKTETNMKLKPVKVACVMPVFKKPSRRVSGALRHVVFSRGLTGTKNLVFRAGRYSVHQLVRSLSALLAAIVVLPNLLKKAFLYLKPKKREGGPLFGSISASIISFFAGIPSMFRSMWTSVKASFLGFGTSVYHVIESAKSFVMGFKITQAISHMNQAIWSFFVGTYQSIKIPVSHFAEYVSAVWAAFRTGTAEKLERLWAKEKEWAHDLKQHLDDDRNYVSGALHQVFAAVGSFFQKISDTVSNAFYTAGAKVRDGSRTFFVKIRVSAGAVGNFFKQAPGTVSNFFTKAPGVAKEKAQYVILQIHDAATNTANKVKIAMADLLEMLRGAGEKLHEEEVHVKTVAHNIQAKARDFVEGIKVGTVEIIRKVGDKGKLVKEQAELYFKAAQGKLSAGRLFIKRRVNMRIEQASAAAHHLRQRIAETERSTRSFFVHTAKKVEEGIMSLMRPLLAPFVHVARLPHRMYESFPSPSVSSYMALLSAVVLSYWLYLKIDCRYKREMYARKLPPSPKVRNGCQEFHLTDSVLRQCMEKLRAQIDMGLNPATREKATVKCFNTYVQDLPTGREKGQFLALDLGGTNFRVLLITLNGRHFDMQSKIYVVPKEIMTGDGEQLFDHIASCLESFALQHRVANKNLPLGFTFSFPLLQVGLKSGFLQRWTKGFNCANTVGKDVVLMLQEALQKKSSTKIEVVAILNDTTGTLMSCAWKNHNCKIGVILDARKEGTGSNACYVEKITNVIGFDGDESKPHVIINTEWGAFGDNGELDFVRTPYDKEIDKHSVNPGKQLFEKMVSGMYLGELARLLIVKFTKDKVLFGGQNYPRMQERWNFLTEYISEIESDPRGVFKQCRNVLGKLGVLDPTDQDCSNIRYICESVSRRAAHLASAGVATLINKMDIPSITVGVDGSLYRYHPHFHNLMHEKIPELCNQSIENLNINLMLSEDGSGRGAALIAASGTDHLKD